MKKIIGVMPLWDDEKSSIWMLPGYLDGIKQAGGLPIILPILDKKEDIIRLCEMCDGYLFTGGHDVSPKMYGEVPLANTEACEKRDYMEKIILTYAIQKDKPILGICRGIQFINAALGGTLYQDLPSQYESETEHHMIPPYDRVCHTVNIVNGTPLKELLMIDEMGVNSYHHQAVKVLSNSLRAMAFSEDGLVEAVYMPGKKFIWALQWHPEFSYKKDEKSKKIFEKFVNSL